MVKMRVMKSIANFHLELLPQEWVTNIWSKDCFDENELPDEYELQLMNNDFSAKMVLLIDAINKWDSFDSCGSSRSSDNLSLKSWKALINEKFDYKALLCLISVFMKRDIKELTREERNLSFTASRLYFTLLSIPGSLVFNIFNPILYEKALNVFHVPFLIKSKPKSHKKYIREVVPGNDDSAGLGAEISADECDEILNEIFMLLDVISQCLEELHLKDEEESLMQTVHVLVNLTQIETGINVLGTMSKLNLTGQVASKSYKILEQLCVIKHGKIEKTILIVLRFFLPTIVVREEDVKIAIRAHFSFNINTFIFIEQLLRSHENDALLGIKALIQQLCVRMPDRSEIRVKVIPHIVQLLRLFSYKDFQDIVLWIVSLAHAEMMKHRLCAIELISKLLSVTDKTDMGAGIQGTHDNDNAIVNDSNISENVFSNVNKRSGNLLHKLLLGAVLSRSLDVSPILRHKSLNIFASLILSNQKEMKEIMEELFITPYKNTELNNDESVPFFDFQNYFNTNPENLQLPKNPLPSTTCMMKSVELLAFDQKVFVRRSALHFITNVCLLNNFWLTEKRMKMLVNSSRDNSLMIRKFTVKYLTDLLLMYPYNKQLIEAWVQGVVSLIADNDVKCQEKVFELIGNVILENLTDYNKTNNEFTKLPWEVLNAIAEGGKRIFFRVACQKWSINKSITKRIFKSIESHVGTEHNYCAWFLIVCITEFQDCPDPKFISRYFLENIGLFEETGENIGMLVVEALFLNWRGIDKKSQEEIYLRLRMSLESFDVPLTFISRYLDICYVSNRIETKTWCKKLVQLCEKYMKNYFASDNAPEIYEPKLCQHIHTLGDASQFHPGVDGDVINYLANMIDPTSSTEGVTLHWKGTVSNTIKAVAVVTLGKICLQEHFIAKAYAPVLANTLNENSSNCVKINSMIALTDLCVRFTSVVEDYLGDMCSMLKDKDVNVRTNSLKLLLQMVQEDYLKPKGAFFFYLLITLRDPVTSVKDLTEAFFSNMLLQRNPSIMSQFFIQAIFFFNDYEGAGSFNKETLTPKEKKIFSMAGVKNFNERGSIYKYMLSNMRDDHRFKLLNRICGDILDEVIDGHIPLDKIGSAVLKDALFAMACDEMRLENLRKSDEDSSDKESEDFIESGSSEAVLGIAKKAFISRIVKANYVECIVPTIIKLKRILAERKSPLVRDLMICLRELMKDFKEEIGDILHADPELAAEVSLDLKNISKDEESINNIYGIFNIREVRVSCERLSEKALSEKMGISIASIKSLQSQSLALFNSKPPIPDGSTVPIELPKNQDYLDHCSNEGNTRFKRNSESRQLSGNNLGAMEISSDIAYISEKTRSSLRISPVDVCRSNVNSKKKGRSSNSTNSSPESLFEISPPGCSQLVSKEYRKLRSSQDTEFSFSSLSPTSISSLEVPDSVNTQQRQENNTGLSGKQLRGQGTNNNSSVSFRKSAKKNTSQDSSSSSASDSIKRIQSRKRAKSKRK